jgi:hypothetical protein
VVDVGLLLGDEGLGLVDGGLGGGVAGGQVQVDLQVFELAPLLADAGEALPLMQVLQKGGEAAELAVLLAALEGVDLIEVLRLQQSRDVVVLSEGEGTSTMMTSLESLPRVRMSLRK